MLFNFISIFYIIIKFNYRGFSMKKVFFIFAVFLLTLTSSAFSECKVTVGWEEWEPYQFKNSNGVLSGVDIEIIKAAFDESGCKAEFKEMPWKRQLVSVEDGSLNVAPGASILPERKKYADFSQAYRDESFSLFFLKGGNDKYKISKLEDLIQYNIKIGTVRGFFYGKKFEDAMKNPKFKAIVEEADDDEMNIKKLDGGRIQAIIIDPFVGIGQMKKLNMIGKVEKNPLPLISGTIHAMFSKKSVTADTIKAFNDGLQKIRKNGKLNQIIAKYLK